MTEQEFLNGFAEIVGVDPASLGMDVALASLEGWDSVAYLGAMVFLEEQMGVILPPESLSGAKTAGDIYSSAMSLRS